MRALIVGVEGELVEQHLGREDVVAHRGQDRPRIIGHRLGVARLLPEPLDPIARSPLDHPELVSLIDWNSDSRNCDSGSRLDVLCKHLFRIHPVDVIGSEYEQIVGVGILDQIEVLIDRVGRAQKPSLPEPHLGWNRGHVVAKQGRHPPGSRYMHVQGMALVLGQDNDFALATVDQIGQSEINEPVVTTERDRRLGTITGQGHQAPPLTAG